MMSLSAAIKLLQPGIDVRFHIEWSTDVVSMSAYCEANNKADTICILCHSN